jgi:hypothetical protein
VINQIARTIGHLSPIDMFSIEQLRKLGRQSNGVVSFFKGLDTVVKENMDTLTYNSLNSQGRNRMGGFSGYFSGRKMGELGNAIDQSTLATRAAVRRTAGIGLGVYAGASMFWR